MPSCIAPSLHSIKSATPGDDKQPPPYFISYSVHDTSALSISAQFGALTTSGGSRERMADVQVRVGSPKLDNTHGEHRSSAVNSMALPLGDDREAIARTLWLGPTRVTGTRSTTTCA